MHFKVRIIFSFNFLCIFLSKFATWFTQFALLERFDDTHNQTSFDLM